MNEKYHDWLKKSIITRIHKTYHPGETPPVTVKELLADSILNASVEVTGKFNKKANFKTIKQWKL